MIRQMCAVSILVLAPIASTVMATENIHWSYSGDVGPEHWGELAPRFSLCGSGKNQSPIDLGNFVEADLKPIKFMYEAGTTVILNNGHTVQIDYASGHSIAVDTHEFELKQFHFHTPSENTIHGEHFPLEAHLVHVDQDGNIAVVSVIFAEGLANTTLRKLWDKMPEQAGDENILPDKLNVSGILPAVRDYYRFNGSFTTPPCTEGVLWLVMKESVSASKSQNETLARIMHRPNNRPVQAINARLVLE